MSINGKWLNMKAVKDNKRILGNFIVAFCTAYLSATFVGFNEAFFLALSNAVIVGLLSAGNEMLKEADECNPIKRVMAKAVLL